MAVIMKDKSSTFYFVNTPEIYDVDVRGER